MGDSSTAAVLSENTNLNSRLTGDLIGRHGIHALKVHAVDK